MAERSSSSQSDRAVVLLREMLLRGAFKPGERLTELSLVPQLQVSRTPVRHAMARLAHEGLLEELPRGGFRVRAFTVDEIWNAIELRGILEGAAARLAAERLTDPSTLVPAKNLLVAMDRALPRNLADFVAYLQMNEEFHREIWKLAGNSMLLRNIEHVVQLPFAAPGALVFGEAEVPEAQRTADLAQAQHQAIVEAIERGAGLARGGRGA